MIINSIQAQNIHDGDGGYAALSIQFGRILNTLKGSVSSYMSARSPLAVELGPNGKVVFSAQPYKGYLSSEWSIDQVSENMFEIIQRTIELKHIRTNNFICPITDLRYMQEGTIQNAIALENMSTLINVDLTLAMYRYLNEFASDHPDHDVYFPELAERGITTTDQDRQLQKDLGNIKIDLVGQIDDEAIFTNGNEYKYLINAQAALNIHLLLTKLNISAESMKLMIQGAPIDTNLQVFNFAGSQFAVDYFLGRNIESNVVVKDAGCDNSNVLGFVMHNDFFAFPVNFIDFINVRDTDNALPKYIVIYAYGFGVLRPQRYMRLVKNFAIFQDPINPLQIHNNARHRYTLGEITYSSSDTSAITINAQTGLMAKVGTGEKSATITATLGSGASAKTATLSVTLE